MARNTATEPNAEYVDLPVTDEANDTTTVDVPVDTATVDAPVAPTDDAPVVDAPDEHNDAAASLAEVAYFDGSSFTFDLHLADRKVSFVDGKATVDDETTTLLRDGGYIA